jgi:hypothetical protein
MMDDSSETSYYCRSCRRALNRLATGEIVRWAHASELRGERVDHPASPVRLTELADPLIECDFCSQGTPTTVFVCADRHTQVDLVTKRVVGLSDYQRRHRAARTRRVETEPGITQAWGQRWSACDPCAALIEQRDLYGLINRVTDHVPPKFTRRNRLAVTRAHLHGLYGEMFDTLLPGAGRITAEHPLGVWDNPPPGLATSGHAPDRRCQ